MTHSRFAANLAVIGILAAVYFAAGKLGLLLAFVHASATAVWPPTGIALAAFLVFGYGVWPGILAGAFLVNITTAGSVATVSGIAVGNTLEGLVGAYLVNRFASGRRAFDRPQDVFKFAVLAGMVSTTVSASFGVTSLSLGGYADWSNYGSIWLTWWLGDAGGALIVAPLLVLWSASPRLRWDRQVPEAALLLVLLFLVGQAVFGGWAPLAIRNYPLEFLSILILVWAAFRLGQRETATATFVLSGTAIWGTLRGFGPFAREAPNESLLLLQAFMGVISVMGMALAAAVLERTRAEEGLRENEERYRLVAESASDAIITIDEESRILFANPAAEKIFGYTRDELIGQPLTIAMPESLRPIHRASVRRYLETGKRHLQWDRVQLPGLHKSGREIPLEISFAEFIREGKRLFTGVVRDITERQQAEEALRESEARYRTLFDGVPVGLYRTTPGGQIVDANPAMVEMLGYPNRETLLAANAADLYLKPEDRGQWQALLELEGVVQDFEAQVRRKDGTLIWVQDNGQAVRDTEGEVVYYEGTLRDITERKRAAEEVQRIYQEAEQRRQEAEAYAALVKDLAASLELERALERLVVKAKVLGQGDFAFLALVEKDGQTLTVRAETGAPPVTLQGVTRIKGKGMTGKVLETGEALVTADYFQDTRFTHDYDDVVRAEGSIAQAAVPVIHEGAPLGVLVVARRTPRPFTASEVQLLVRLADAASLVCHNALLYQQATSRAVALERLWRVGQALSHSLALPETLDRIVHTACDLLRADHARLTLWDEAAQCLTVAAQALGKALPLRETVHLGEGVIGTVAQTRRPLIVNDYQAFPHRISELTTVIASVGVPLLIEDRLVGVLAVGVTEAGRTFTAEDLQLLELLAQPAAIAIENARLFEQVRAGRERLQVVSRRLLKVQEGERRHIARELHDEVGQALTAIKINLQAMQLLSASESLSLRLQESIGTVEHTIQQVRNLSLDLRPSVLDDLGLVAALRWHVDRHAHQAGLVTQFVADPPEIRAPPDIETACFRVAQEALTNVMRHAQARRVRLELRRREAFLELLIQDDGVGFHVNETEERAVRGASFGLLGMHERAQLVGGQIKIESAPKAGTTVHARFPLTAFLEKRGEPRA